MARPKPEVEETSLTVGRNVLRLRNAAQLSLRELADRMPADHPLRFAAIGEVERGVRRVSVDDLTALAAALDVSPVALLLPHTLFENRPEVRLAGVPETRPGQLLHWLRGRLPLGNQFAAAPDFSRRSLPGWAWPWERFGDKMADIYEAPEGGGGDAAK